MGKSDKGKKVFGRREVLRRGLWAAAAPLGVSLWVSGCERKVTPSSYSNIILISVDTLRADHCGCFGYKRDTTPRIDAFAAENVLFKKCFIGEPNTAASHISMLCGLYPYTHATNQYSQLSSSVTMVQQVLKAAGYTTLGFVRECSQLHPGTGIARGFDLYIEEPYDAEEENEVIIRHLKKRRKEKLFVFIHYYDVHSDWKKLPYDAPEPYGKKYCADYAGDFTGGDGKVFASAYLQYVNRSKIRLAAEDLEYIEALYDGGVAYTDEYVGQMLDELKGLGLYDSSLIFVTSDHGEEFQEHGYMLHANPYYYDALSHVPLIVKAPGHEGTGRVVDEFVESIDFAPSMLGWAGVKNVPAMQGADFMGLLEGSENWVKDTVYGFSVKGGPEACLRNMRWKLMAGDMQKAADYRLYDLLADPDEKVDSAGYYASVAEELRGQLLEKFVSLGERRGAKEVPLTQEQMRMLKSLGYVE